jgi:hypothetical protein
MCFAKAKHMFYKERNISPVMSKLKPQASKVKRFLSKPRNPQGNVTLFTCKDCGSDFKGRTNLLHHKVIH